MAGITRLSAPNRARLAAAQRMPMTPAGRFSFFFHCSMNSTTNKAVSTKSMPVVSKVMKFPARLPSTDPMIQ